MSRNRLISAVFGSLGDGDGSHEVLAPNGTVLSHRKKKHLFKENETDKC